MLRTTPALAAAAISTVTDVHRGYIYDRVVLPAGVAAIAASVISGDVPTAIWGASIAGGVLLSLRAVTKGKGMGLGDVKLALILGWSLGVFGALAMLAAAFVLGGAIACTLLILGKKRCGDTIPFAPFLAAGFCAAILAIGSS